MSLLPSSEQNEEGVASLEEQPSCVEIVLKVGSYLRNIKVAHISGRKVFPSSKEDFKLLGCRTHRCSLMFMPDQIALEDYSHKTPCVLG